MRFATVILLSTAILLLSGSNTNNIASAQVSIPGRFRPHQSSSRYIVADSDSEERQDPIIPLYKPYFRWSTASQEQVQAQAQGRAQGPPVMSSMPVLQMPHMDNAQLLNDENGARAQLLAAGGADDGAYQFGKAIVMDSLRGGAPSTLSSGRWTHLKKTRSQYSKNDDDNEEEDVMVWQLEIYSKSALSLNLIFSDFHLPPDSEFYVVSNGNGGTHLLGAFTGSVNNKPDRVFATAPVAGDRLLLEFYIPRSNFLQGTRPSIELSHVIHGYKPTLLAASSDLTAKGVRMADGSVVPRDRRKPRRRQGGLRVQQSFANPLSDWDQHSVSFTGNDEDDNMPVRAMSGKCNIDVACHQNYYHDQSRSVGAILSDYNQKYCTGALINNARQDGRQLFLTANHCSGFADTSAHLVMFNHEKIQCGSSPEEVNEHDTAMGLIKLGSYADSDYTLYEIVENIPDAYSLYLSGWSALTTPPTSRLRNLAPEQPEEPEKPEDGDEDEDENDGGLKSPWRTVRHKKNPNPTPAPTPPVDPSLTQIPVVGIHHPSGDSKKISFFYNGSLPRACWSECQPGEMYHWQIPRWDQGTTEPGSSGSPLFDADKRIVGQLHGGSASCWNRNGYDVYGAIHASFSTPPKIKDRLSTYLDPEGTGVKVLDGYGLEQARRDATQRRLEGEEEMVEFEPLGRPGLEKPLSMEDEDESHLDSPSHGRYRHRRPHHRHRPNNVARLSRFMNKFWQGLVQVRNENINNNDIDDMAASPVTFEEDQVPCDQFRK